jgi:hypothetical protein
MYWVNIIKDIYRKLDANGLLDISYEIGEEHIKGGTPGEMFTLLVEKLISIKDHQPELYAVIEDGTEWMIAYTKTIGYL